MNVKRLLLAIVAGYVVIFATDWLIHEKWLAPDYAATQQVWRAKEDMASLGLWFLGAQIVTVLTFVLLWTRWASTAQIGCAIGFGFLIGAFSGAWPMVLYAILPIPGALAAKWFFAGIVQCILLGSVTFYVYKPAASGTAN